MKVPRMNRHRPSHRQVNSDAKGTKTLSLSDNLAVDDLLLGREFNADLDDALLISGGRKRLTIFIDLREHPEDVGPQLKNHSTSLPQADRPKGSPIISPCRHGHPAYGRPLRQTEHLEQVAHVRPKNMLATDIELNILELDVDL